MKTIIHSFVILIIITLVSCDKSEGPVINNSSDIYGFWINPVENDTIITFSKSISLKENDYGFAIKPGQLFIERKNAGWCGTPPIAYADYEGAWARTDSMLTISVGYWGGIANYKWKIISIDNNSLSIYRMDEVFDQ